MFGIASGYELDGRGSIPSNSKGFFFILQGVQTGPGTEQTFYTMDTAGSFFGDRATEGWN
jgi:hypothetical protein